MDRPVKKQVRKNKRRKSNAPCFLSTDLLEIFLLDFPPLLKKDAIVPGIPPMTVGHQRMASQLSLECSAYGFYCLLGLDISGVRDEFHTFKPQFLENVGQQ